MGMFDYIRCDYPLPDGFDSGLDYQTKDTPQQYLVEYVITEAGELVEGVSKMLETQETVLSDFHGRIEFYTTNWQGFTPPNFVCTNDDEPPWYRNYVATFTEGKLTKITGGLDEEGPDKDSVHVSREEFRKLPSPARPNPHEPTRTNKGAESSE